MLRPALFAAALIAGASFYFADAVVAPGGVHAAWKGAGVGLLAVWAAAGARSGDGWLFALVLASGAIGDVLLEVAGLSIGAIAFLAGHVLAVGLYLRNRRVGTSGSQRGLALTLLIGTPLISWLLSRDIGVAAYAVGLGAMASSLWASRFPRYRAGIGAVLFVVSDLLIFARMGSLAESVVPELLIWPTYFAGQALIAWGVGTVLAREEHA